ncbi:MAG: hypothetical protein ACTSU2_11590 [Promethearchaeota archaeon]
MPMGIFLIEIDPKSKAHIRNIYFADPSHKIALDNNLILKLRMGLSESPLYIHLERDFSIISYISDFKRNKEHYSLIVGLILNKNEDANNYRDGVKIFSNKFLEKVEDSKLDLSDELKETFEELFSMPSMILSKEALEERLKNKVKKLTKDGNFDQAKKLLDLIKKTPKKLYDANKNGESALRSQDYDKAEREFNKALKYAKELNENDLVSAFKEKIKIVKEIPKLKDQLEKNVANARESLRNDNFEAAYKYYRTASKIAKKLLDADATEEYSLKAEALAKFWEVHKRFHRNK